MPQEFLYRKKVHPVEFVQEVRKGTNLYYAPDAEVYLLASYSPDMNETAVFLADERGEVSSWKDPLGYVTGEDHEKALEQALRKLEYQMRYQAEREQDRSRLFASARRRFATYIDNSDKFGRAFEKKRNIVAAFTRRLARDLPEEYSIPVTSAQLDPEVILWFHRGQSDPVYALGSRLVPDRPANVGRTKASVEELEELEIALKTYLESDDADRDPEEDIYRIETLLANTQQILANKGRWVSVEQMDDFDFESFFEAYIEAALWSSSCDEEDDCENLDEKYGPSDISDECLDAMRTDCKKFVEANKELLAQADYNERWSDEEMAGHDFWLTRNGHGAGFWDRGLGDVGDALTDAAHAFGEVWIYVGDDGQLYC